MIVTVVYGSESKILSNYIEKHQGTIIRLYNNNIPKPKDNCIDIKFSSQNFIELGENLDRLLSRTQKLIFLGAAFGADKNLFMLSENSDFDNLIKINIENYIKLSKFILHYMLKIGNGKFIYLSSFRSKIPTRGTSIYSASKAFGEIFFKSLGIEYGRFNISTHIVRMGYFDGRLLDDFSDQKKTEILKKISKNRLGNAEDLYQLLNYLENHDYSNSGVIELNGGLDFL